MTHRTRTRAPSTGQPDELVSRPALGALQGALTSRRIGAPLFSAPSAAAAQSAIRRKQLRASRLRWSPIARAFARGPDCEGRRLRALLEALPFGAVGSPVPLPADHSTGIAGARPGQARAREPVRRRARCAHRRTRRRPRLPSQTQDHGVLAGAAAQSPGLSARAGPPLRTLTPRHRAVLGARGASRVSETPVTAPAMRAAVGGRTGRPPRGRAPARVLDMHELQLGAREWTAPPSYPCAGSRTDTTLRPGSGCRWQWCVIRHCLIRPCACG